MNCKHEWRPVMGKTGYICRLCERDIDAESWHDIYTLTTANADLQQRLDTAQESLKVAQGEGGEVARKVRV